MPGRDASHWTATSHPQPPDLHEQNLITETLSLRGLEGDADERLPFRWDGGTHTAFLLDASDAVAVVNAAGASGAPEVWFGPAAAVGRVASRTERRSPFVVEKEIGCVLVMLDRPDRCLILIANCSRILYAKQIEIVVPGG